MGWKKMSEASNSRSWRKREQINTKQLERMAHENKSTNKVRANTRVKRCNKA